MSCYVIREISLAHCKRGPERCEQCRQMQAGKACLLDICPPDAGMMQRRVIEIIRGGETEWCEFDVVKVFENHIEARAYARHHDIHDVNL